MRNGEVTGLTAPWLATRMGLQSAMVERMRRAGELVAVRRADGQLVYPSWQFGRDGRPLPALPRVVAVARGRGISDERLAEILSRRAGLTGDARLADVLREGREDEVMRALEASS